MSTTTLQPEIQLATIMLTTLLESYKLTLALLEGDVRAAQYHAARRVELAELWEELER